ncbi:MAG: hypothetical protein AAF196_07745 [Planctomycetota bacterium]
MDEYDEHAELDRYVWDYHSGLFTELELQVRRAHHAELKASDASEPMARMLRERFGAQGDRDVMRALADGWATFQSVARARVMRDHPDTVVVNRCPDCGRVVKTPKARQCMWCGCDWHRE